MPSVSAAQRFRKDHPCPICGGYKEAPQGQGSRCWGFLSDDGRFAHCVRDEHAGRLSKHPNSDTYRHRLIGDCLCGVRHDPSPSSSSSNGAGPRRQVATYDYHNEAGTLVYQVVRYAPKGFSQRCPNGQGGWLWKLDGVRRLPYALPELIAAVKTGDTIFIPEGEKDCRILQQRGLVATTNSEGAGNWHNHFAEFFRGAQVVLLPDNDDEGRQHIAKVSRNLAPVVKWLKRVELPGLPKHGDVSDWLKAGHTVDELLALVDKAPIIRPEDLSDAEDHRGLELTSLADLLQESDEELPWLVDTLLPSRGFSLLAGKPKAGKSTFARCLALVVARGEPFLGRETTKGPVVYLALEEKRSEIRKHFREMGANGDEAIYTFAATAPTDALERIRTVAEAKHPALIIIDPLFRLTRVKDGNDYAQVTQALEPLLALARETGSHVLCAHHLGKGERSGGDAILGSTAIFAAVDTALILKRLEYYRTLASIQRYGEDLEETVLRFDTTTRTISLGELKEKEDEQRIAKAILEYLEACEQEEARQEAPTEPEITAAVEGWNRLKRSAIRSLVNERKVERVGKGARGDPFRYALPNSRLLVRPIDNVQAYENPKSAPSPDQHSDDSRTSDFAQSEIFANPAYENSDPKKDPLAKEDRCPRCGGQDWAEWHDGRRVCMACLRDTG